MSRVKRGVTAHLRHKKVLKLNQGYFGSRHRLFRRANEAMLKSMWYATRDRKVRKRDLRKLWIVRINAAARLNGLSYSQLMHALKVANITLNRKVLADLAVRDPNTFAAIVTRAKAA
ncbi:MAG TPA: 50S ribosomal protein L20 [Anaerolineaceae bacterium]|jgi:large subunit ribosomal protein L20|nr:50S ribosomal protein L20 [Anaerolineaceae bacterium]